MKEFKVTKAWLERQLKKLDDEGIEEVTVIGSYGPEDSKYLNDLAAKLGEPQVY